MTLKRVSAFLTICAVAASSGVGSSVEGSAYNVYYRVDPNSPWVFYTGSANSTAANETCATLQASGYTAQVVAGNGGGNAVVGGSGMYSQPASAWVNPGVGVGSYPYGSHGGGYGARTWGNSAGYSYGGGANYGAGAFRNADNWHHHSHSSQSHSHTGDDNGANSRATQHPTTNPHARSAAHHSSHLAGTNAHHAGAGAHNGAHHGSHHGHSHSHSHGDHHGKK
jgi:hypothetical protein